MTTPKTTDAARALAASLGGYSAGVSVSVWFDERSPYLKVYIATEGKGLLIPTEFRGFKVVSELMPDFVTQNSIVSESTAAPAR